MEQVKTNTDETYRNLSEERIAKITDALGKLNYPQETLDKEVLIYIAQWLYDSYVSIESTCYIISNLTNINRLQKTIEDIYDGVIMLTAQTHLSNFLAHDEFETIKEVMDPRKTEGVISGEIDDNTNIVVNFKLEKVLQEKLSFKRNGEINSKFTPVIEACPKELIVYDSPLLDQPRTFKIKWSSKFTNRNFITAGESSGATIKEIENYLIDAGFSHSPKLVGGALSCMINTMIDNELAIIKTDIDNPGVYYSIDNDKIIVVDKDFSETTRSEMVKASNTLTKLSTFFNDNLDVLATVFKYGLMSEFSYAMKQAGNWMPWLYLKGTSQAGKTTIAKIPLYTWTIPSDLNNIGGSSFDTVARVGAKLSMGCDVIVVNEPAAVFNRDSTKEMVKVSVQSTVARSRFRGSYFGGVPAFSPVIFTANQYLPEDDALLNRFFVISFSYSQRKTDAEKKRFEDTFHVETPSISVLQDLQVFGRYALRYIINHSSALLDGWQETADKIVNGFYHEMGADTPEWLMLWVESENLDDFDSSQREDIRNFFISEFNHAKKKVRVVSESGYNVDETLDIDDASSFEDFEDVNWSIVNNRMLSYALPRVSRRGTKHVCFSQGLRKALSESTDFCSDLKSIGELMGWDYKNVKINGRQQKMIDVSFSEFLEFLYPNVEFDNDL